MKEEDDEKRERAGRGESVFTFRSQMPPAQDDEADAKRERGASGESAGPLPPSQLPLIVSDDKRERGAAGESIGPLPWSKLAPENEDADRRRTRPPFGESLGEWLFKWWYGADMKRARAAFTGSMGDSVQLKPGGMDNDAVLRARVGNGELTSESL